MEITSGVRAEDLREREGGREILDYPQREADGAVKGFMVEITVGNALYIFIIHNYIRRLFFY